MEGLPHQIWQPLPGSGLFANHKRGQKVMRLATPEFIRRFLIHVLPAVFVKQVVRRFHAASVISEALISVSGLSQTGPAGCQLRV